MARTCSPISTRHRHAAGRVVESLRILLHPEQVEISIGAAIGLGALENHLAAVKHFCGGIERKRAVRPYHRIVPALLRSVALRKHAARKDAPEAELLRKA